MKRIVILTVLALFLSTNIGCATILYPSRQQARSAGTNGTYDVGMLILNILFTPLKRDPDTGSVVMIYPIGIIIDLVTGAAWMPNDDYGRKIDIEEIKGW